MRWPMSSARSYLSRVLPRSWWLLALALGLASPASAQAPGTWAPMADLNQARAEHTATLLANGTVLIAGGRDAADQPLASAEIYDPATGGYTLLASPLPAPVWGHTAIRLNDGTVLIAGGQRGARYRRAAQLFDPATDTFTALGPMSTPRGRHTATLLRDGRVVVIGGTDGVKPLASLEIYDPTTRTFSLAPSALAVVRQDHTTTLLPDGRILVVGGSNASGALDSAEIYDPTAGTVSPAAPLNVPRTLASAALLLDGTVLVAGGQTTSEDLDSAEVYDAATNTFAWLPAAMGTARSGHLGVQLLHNGKVLISGGTSGGQLVANAEVYDPITGAFQPVDSPGTARRLFGANFFEVPYTGILLASGGFDGSDQPLASSEVFFYPTLRSDKPDYAPGETVTLMGEGWRPNETIAINIRESSGDPDTNLTATAGATGAFSNSEFQMNLLDRGVKFTATARGLTSGWTAQAKFTDAITSTLDQCKDDTNNDDLKDPCVWQNGSINPGDSAYHEGDSVAFRIWLDGLNPGSTHTVTIRYDFTKQTSGGVIVLGYDFLTHPDATETATSQRCNNIPGGVGVTGTTCLGMSGPDTVAIPSDAFTFSSLSAPNAALSGQAVSSRETAGRQVVIFGGTFTSPFISSIGKDGNPNTDSDSRSQVTLTFTVGSGSAAACTTQGQTTTCAVNILFGGHLAKGTADASGWGTGRGASSFPGASISMRMHSVDGNSSGAVNRSIQSAAVLAPAQGHIIVDKVTSPSGDPTSFSFSTTGTGYASFSLTDAATPNGQTLSPGAYSVSEAIPAGWVLTGLSCASSLGTSTFTTTAPPVAGPGTATASITLAAGDTVTCTFTDTKRGQIVVDKVTSPSGDPTSFSFSTTGTGYASFSLTDAATPNGQTLSPGAYSVSEAIPAGWVLTGLSCVSSLGTSTFTTTAPPVAGPGTATASITLAANDTVTCTFTDTKQVGHIIIAKRTIPPGAITPFAFTTTGPGGYTNTFTLTDGGSNDQTLAPGSYSVSETVPMDWIATLSCSGPATSSFPTAAPPVTGPGTATASITLAADDTVTCTFTNTGVSQPPPEPEPQDPIITTVSCNPPTVQVNQPTTCTATVSQVVVGTPITTPTGIARFFADASTTAFATCTLRATATTGVANCSVAYRASTVGVHNIAARYPGDSTHEASTTLTPFPVTVVPAVPGLGL